jgi:hypothetical protein
MAASREDTGGLATVPDETADIHGSQPLFLDWNTWTPIAGGLETCIGNDATQSGSPNADIEICEGNDRITDGGAAGTWDAGALPNGSVDQGNQALSAGMDLSDWMLSALMLGFHLNSGGPLGINSELGLHLPESGGLSGMILSTEQGSANGGNIFEDRQRGFEF